MSRWHTCIWFPRSRFCSSDSPRSYPRSGSLDLPCGVTHEVHGDDLSLKTTAPLSRLLTTSQAISTAVSLTVPVVMAVHAYQIASDWLTASKLPGSRPRPSPFQLGLLVHTVQGANIFAFANICSYLSPNRAQQAPDPTPIQAANPSCCDPRPPLDSV